MRIIHTSDWHLGQNFMNKSRKEEHEAFLKWLLIQLEENEVDALVVAGDIFDTGTPPGYARTLYYEFMRKFKDTGCRQMIIVGGNHDSPLTLNEASKVLEVLDITVIGGATENPEDEVFVLKDRSGKESAVICAIPFLRDRDVRKSNAGESAKEKSEALRRGITDHYKASYNKARQLADAIGTAIPIFATGHLTTKGKEPTEGVRELSIGGLEGFKCNEFPQGLDYIALGHLHKKEVMGERAHIRYCGSPIPLSFIEAEYDRTVNLVDIKAGETPAVKELVVPTHRSLKTLRGSFPVVKADLQKLADENKILVSDDQQNITTWLQIEINVEDGHHDSSNTLRDIIQDTSIELLRIRLVKKSDDATLSRVHAEKLNDLSIEEVFAKRLEQSDFSEEKQEEINTTFKQIHNEVLEEKA